MFTFLLFGIFGLIIYLFFTKFVKGNTSLIVDENSFTQNGVRVDFNEKTITINGYPYNVELIKGISYEKKEPRGEKLLRTAEVKIQVDDFKKPVHIISFGGFNSHKNADEFMQRISMALRKTGGPSFV